MKRRILNILLASAMTVGLLAGCNTAEKDPAAGAQNPSTPATASPDPAKPESTPETEKVSEIDGEKLADKQILVYNAGNDANVYDPRNSNGMDQKNVLKQLFMGFFIKNADGSVENALAEDYTISDDFTVYTITLKDNMLWSDGSPITIDDFYYAWTTAIAPETMSKSLTDYFIVKGAAEYNAGDITIDELGIKVLDEKTIEITLAYANNDFIRQQLATTAFAPVKKEVVEADPVGWFLDADTFICNGPFKMTVWSPKEEIVMEKNENFVFADRVKLDTLRYVFADEPTTAMAAFLVGDIDINTTIPPTDVEKLIADGQVVTKPRLGINFYSFNMHPDLASDTVKATLWKKEVRYAMSLSIDREAIVKTVTKGGQTPAQGFAPIGIQMPNGEDYALSKSYDDVLAYDPERAKSLMAEAGFPNGEGFPKLTMFYNTAASNQAIAEVLQDMWKQNLGIDIELINKETNVFSDERKLGLYEIVRGGNSCIEYHPAVLEIFTSEDLTRNDGKWINAEYDDLIQKAKESIDLEQKFDFYRQAEDVLMEELPCIPLYYSASVIAMQPQVRDFYMSPAGYVDFIDAYIVD